MSLLHSRVSARASMANINMWWLRGAMCLQKVVEGGDDQLLSGEASPDLDLDSDDALHCLLHGEEE